MHLATSLDEEVFKQLTAPNLVMVLKRGGFTSNEWRKSFQDRDEVLDCAVYARAAAYSGHIGMGRMTLAQWEALAIERGAPPDPAQLDTACGRRAGGRGGGTEAEVRGAGRHVHALALDELRGRPWRRWPS